MAFCDFCTCEDCKFGTKHLWHAKTSGKKYICDVCYEYDLCTSGPNQANHPCENKNCKHRPKIISKWTKYERD